MVAAYGEAERMKKKIWGGDPNLNSVWLTMDAGKLGNDQKSNVVTKSIFQYPSKVLIFQGRASFNKGYVQILREEGDEALYALFANPSGGPERLSHIASLWEKIQPKSVVKVDTARAYLAAAMDDFEKGVVLLQISHKQAKEYGLSWTLIVGPEEEKLFGGLVVTDENGLKTVRVISTWQTFRTQTILSMSLTLFLLMVLLEI